MRKRVDDNQKQCQVCGKYKKVYITFGKNKCQNCINQSKTGKKGNSGMVYDKNASVQFEIFSEKLTLIKVKKSDSLFVKWYIEHYPQSKGIVGRQINYKILYKNEPIGIISCASPPLNYKKFRNYFSTKNEKLFVNNNVFRLVNKPNDNNIGTKILKLFRNTIKTDYKKIYDDNLLGIVTFVEPPRTGSIYKADNWDYLGQTQGISVRRRGEDWQQKKYVTGKIKHIYAYKFKEKNRNKV